VGYSGVSWYKYHTMKRILTLIAAFSVMQCTSTDEQINLILQEENLQKEQLELVEEMKSIVQAGLIQFEVYDKQGKLIKTLQCIEDLSPAFLEKFNFSQMSVKSVKNELAFNSNLNLVEK
jgi:hypothetical protein